MHWDQHVLCLNDIYGIQRGNKFSVKGFFQIECHICLHVPLHFDVDSDK